MAYNGFGLYAVAKLRWLVGGFAIADIARVIGCPSFGLLILKTNKMLLTFSKTEFRTLIRKGVKVHTIRDDKHNRWKVGTKIHFWLGNPRNTRAKNKPYQFGVGEVSRVETIRMDFACAEDWQNDVVYIGDDIKLKTPEELNALAVNDGFENWSQMKHWFVNDGGQYFGKIIFWKNFELTANDDGSTVF